MILKKFRIVPVYVCAKYNWRHDGEKMVSDRCISVCITGNKQNSALSLLVFNDVVYKSAILFK